MVCYLVLSNTEEVLSCLFKVPIRPVGILHICNLWISLRKIVIYLVGRILNLRGLFVAVKVDGSDVNPGICLITPGCFNIQTSHGFENFKQYRTCVFCSDLKDLHVFSVYMSITACFHYNCQIPGLTSLPLNLTAKKSTKMKFSTDKIYYNFSQTYPKITINVKSPQAGQAL